MTKFLPLALLSSLLLAACTPNPPIVEPAPEPIPAAVTNVSGTMHLGQQSRAGTPTNGHTDTDAIGKTLIFSIGNPTGTEQKATTTVGSDLKYTITLPTPTDAAMSPATVQDFDDCTTTVKTITPGSRAAYGDFGLQAHADQVHPLASVLDTVTATGGVTTSVNVMYFNQDGRADVIGTCPTGDARITAQFDMKITFRKGWNVYKQVVTTTVNADGTAKGLVVMRNTSDPLDLYAPFQYHAAN